MVAAGLTGVYAETIPNFEVLTLVVFCSGVLLGARDGALVGAVTMLVYSLLNPYGAVHPLVTASQVAGEVLAGLAGAGFAAAGLAAAPIPWRAAMLGTGLGPRSSLRFPFPVNRIQDFPVPNNPSSGPQPHLYSASVQTKRPVRTAHTGQ